MAEVGLIELAGVQCIIEATASRHGGTWFIKDAADNVSLGSGVTFDEAKRRASAEIAKRKVKVEIKFRTMAGEHGVATGIHAKNNSILARLDGEPVQLNGRFHSDRTLREDIPQDLLDRLIEIETQRRALVTEAREITDEWQVDVGKLVKDAIDKKLAEREA